MRKLMVVLAVAGTLAIAGTAEAADVIAFNTYPVGDPALVVITPRATTYSGSQSGISWAGNGYVDVEFTAPQTMVMDKLFFQYSDMNTPGTFHIDISLNGGPSLSTVIVVDPVAPGPTLTDVEWDFATDINLVAGYSVKLRMDHDVNMTGSGSTAARLHVYGSSGAAGTGVFDDGGWYTPMALLPSTPPVPEPAGLGLVGVALLATRKRRAQ